MSQLLALLVSWINARFRPQGRKKLMRQESYTATTTKMISFALLTVLFAVVDEMLDPALPEARIVSKLR